MYMISQSVARTERIFKIYVIIFFDCKIKKKMWNTNTLKTVVKFHIKGADLLNFQLKLISRIN